MRRQLTTPASILIAGFFIIVLALANSDFPSQGAARAVLAYPDKYPSPTTTVTTTVTGTAISQTTIATTSTAVSTTIVPTFGTVSTPTFAQTTPTATVLTTATSSPTPTVVLTPTPVNALTCIPGQPIAVTGEGPPNAGVLMYFNERAVGGGSVDVSGRFSLDLVVGNEKPGRYPVRVQVRGTQQVLRSLDCVVPSYSTPTSTPIGR